MYRTMPNIGQTNACLTLVAVLAFCALALGASDPASENPNTPKAHAGVPTDWSSRHLVMTGESVSTAIDAGDLEPRHVYNLAQRMQAAERQRHPGRRPKPKGHKIDWAVSLENGYMRAAQYPAKYRFAISDQDCIGDYVVFTLFVNSGTQANLVGINNLYTEATPPCNGGTPWVAFAYRLVSSAGGQNRTSPVLSLDGTKVAYVESTGNRSYFHVLVLPSPMPTPPAHSGTVLSPVTPTACATPTTPGCVTTVQISGATNSLSSPWVDYSTDTAYVGTDNGVLYKIRPVFGGGAPVVANDTNWPVTLATSGSRVLTAPVVDNNANVNRIFVGDGNGYLYAVNLTSPAHTYAARLTIGWVGHGAGTGIVDAPVVVTDVANPAMDQVFSFTGCSNVLGFGAAINQVPANFTSASSFTTVDMGSASGTGDCTTGNAHGAAFDDAFWNYGTATGHIMGCGFVSGTVTTPLIPSNPKMYKFGFDVTHNVTAAGAQTWVINNSAGDECAPLTEYWDTVNDRVFFGVGGSTDGFIESSNLTAGFPAPTSCTAGNPNSTCSTTPAGLGGTSGIIIDNTVLNGGTNIYFSTVGRGSVNGQNCHVAGGVANPYCAVKLTQSGLN